MPEMPLRILLVKPHLPLKVARCLQDFLHLEPLELEIVAGGASGEDITICDLTTEKNPLETFRRRFAEIKPQLLGLTGYSNQAEVVKDLARLAKAADPSVLVVVGGIHATLMPADYGIPEIDVVVRGEGGTKFRELVRRVKAGEPPAFGDAVLSPRDQIFAEKAALPPPAFPEVTDIPAPRRDLADRSKYFCAWTAGPPGGRVKTMYPRTAAMRTSYGCAFNCSFCMVPIFMNRKYVERAPKAIVDELAGLPQENVYFVDDETFLNEKRMTEVANLLLERGIKKRYASWARADTIVRHPDLFRLWKKAGLEVLYVGLEAMVERRLQNYSKRTTVETNLAAIAFLREAGITLHASLMVDPDFSVQDFLDLEKVVRSLTPAEISFTVLSPSPASELWKKHRHEFITDTPYLFYDCFHTLLPTKLPLPLFYAHFSRLYRIAWSANPLRVNKVKVPLREILRAITDGVKYVFALRAIARDYRPTKP
jgi:radical SAM superfamily enzyme YgiQ (UPF0313 family)